MSTVYALDTLGAAAGALLAGFVLVPILGLQASTRLMGIAALLLGLILLRRPASAPNLRSPRALPSRVEARLREAEVAEDFREIGMGFDEALRFLNEPSARPDQVPGFLGEGESLNTDDKPILEFSTARNLFELSK